MISLLTDVMKNEAMIEEISPIQACDMLFSDPKAVLLDVRSRVEFDYVGHPINAVNVPWQDAPDWQIDSDFVNKVRAKLQLEHTENHVEDLTLLVICRSGARSMAAAQILAAEGFQKVFNIAEGFEGDKDNENHRGTVNGWRFYKLPWEQT